jgi:hypothetical protein
VRRFTRQEDGPAVRITLDLALHGSAGVTAMGCAGPVTKNRSRSDVDNEFFNKNGHGLQRGGRPDTFA